MVNRTARARAMPVHKSHAGLQRTPAGQLTGVQAGDQGEQGYPDVHRERQRPTAGPRREQTPLPTDGPPRRYQQQRTGQTPQCACARASLTYFQGPVKGRLSAAKERNLGGPYVSRAQRNFLLLPGRTCRSGFGQNRSLPAQMGAAAGFFVLRRR